MTKNSALPIIAGILLLVLATQSTQLLTNIVEEDVIEDVDSIDPPVLDCLINLLNCAACNADC